MTKSIIVVKVPCKLLYVIQVKEFLIKCSTSSSGVDTLIVTKQLPYICIHMSIE